MKQKIALLPVLMLLLGLAACGEAEEQECGFDSARSFAHYHSQQVWATETEDTIYFLGWSEHYIKYVDKATGISGVLCGKPECRHNDVDCNAYIQDARCLLMNAGRLNWIEMKFDPSPKYFVYSMAPDGTDRREEAELPEGYIVSGTHAWRQYVLQDEWLYFGDVSREIIDGEEVLYNYVVAFPFDAGKEPIVILQEENPTHFVGDSVSIQFYDGYLYILTNNVSYYEEESGDARYHCMLRRWNAQTHEMETLYEDDVNDLCQTSELWVTDDGVIFNRNTISTEDVPLENRIYKYDFDSGKCEYLFDNGLHGWPNMGLIADNLITGYEMLSNNDGIYDFYVVIKDFEGNVLVDDTYTLDIRDGYTHYGLKGPISISYNVNFLGRDEEHAYYSFWGSDENGTSHISIISVALDGRGAQVMCTQSENIVYGR